MCGIGKIKEYVYSIEYLKERSERGINGGKIISLLMRKNGRDIFCYENNRTIDGLDDGGKEIYTMLIKRYN